MTTLYHISGTQPTTARLRAISSCRSGSVRGDLLTTPRKPLPFHWCETRDNLLMSLSDIARSQRKIIDLSDNPTVIKLAANTQRDALEGIAKIKELKFEEQEKK